MSLTVVGLGPGPVGYLTGAADKALLENDKLFIQTELHPVAKHINAQGKEFISFDSLYSSCADFESLNMKIAETVISSAENNNTVFGVTGHGTEGQNAVSLILKICSEKAISVNIIPGVSLCSAALCLSKSSVPNGFVSHFGKPDMLRVDTGKVNIIAEIGGSLAASEIKIALMELYPDDFEVSVLQVDTEIPDVKKAALCDIDREIQYDSFTCIVIPALDFKRKTRYSAADLVDICTRLRSPEGCPWDREQTHLTLRSALIEECYEAIAAIESNDISNLCEELGDVLLQVALNSQIAAEYGGFSFTDVTSGICEKLIRRHPHVFAEKMNITASQVIKNWDKIKQNEKGAQKGYLEGTGKGLPALIRAYKLQNKVAKIGFDFSCAKESLTKLYEEARELVAEVEKRSAHIEEEAGDLLFSAVNTVRLCGIYPETALNLANTKFIERFEKMEKLAQNEGLDIEHSDINTLNGLWERSKGI